MFVSWVRDKLEALKDEPILLVQDSLCLLPENDGTIHRFANDNDFTVIVASTNLVFRELFEKTTASKETKKLLVIDRAPMRRKADASLAKAPPPFYPDLLSGMPETARVDIGMRQFLIEKTGDPKWPQEANEPRFARLLIRCVEAVLKAWGNLRIADANRFTDHDFKIIVACAALGTPEAAFKRHDDPQTYWRIAFLGQTTLEELDSLAPDVAETIRKELRVLPAPFSWFADLEPERVIRLFYLSVILSQHTSNWRLLLANIDPAFKSLGDIEAETLQEAARQLVSFDPQRASQDIAKAEASLSRETLEALLIEIPVTVQAPCVQFRPDSRSEKWGFQGGQRSPGLSGPCPPEPERVILKNFEDAQFATLAKNEHYSPLLRSLSLLLALRNLASDNPSPVHEELVQAIAESEDEGSVFTEQFSTPEWKNLKEAYNLLWSVRALQKNLDAALRELSVQPASKWTFDWFWTLWNERRVNRLEYYLSGLTRLVENAPLLPNPASRPSSDLPAVFGTAFEQFKASLERLGQNACRSIDSLNSAYQALVKSHYKTWITSDSPEVCLTSQCLRRCVKPYWDPQKEKAVLFVFDGMRYDIWDELVRPVFEDRMEVLRDCPASSLLPSETHVSRKAIFAGASPKDFDSRSGENFLLKTALRKEFGLTEDVDVVDPKSTGTGETVRYRAGNLDCYIFELCDQELHKIHMKTLPDGRVRPSRPLSFIYKSHIKDIVDTEVTAIVRELAPNTKVFVVADHGFGVIGRDRVGIDPSWLNDADDCRYLNAELKCTLAESGAPQEVRDRVLEFSVDDLQMPDSPDLLDKTTKRSWAGYFKSIVFPKTGCSFSRPKARYNPDAYSHGGISIQEMFVPMLAMKVKTPEGSLLVLGDAVGSKDLIEGEKAVFRIPVQWGENFGRKDVRLEVCAEYRDNEATPALPRRVQHLPPAGGEIVVGFVPDASDASDKERKEGVMRRVLKVEIVCSGGKRNLRKTQTIPFAVRLNSEKIVRRVPSNLGKILGLAPKNMH